MDVMSAKEAAEKWGISQRKVAILCAKNRVPGAAMVGNIWVLPCDAAKPADARGTRHSASGKAAKSFLKWAGGKGQLLEEIEKYYPFANGKITKYAEPFIGGGAVLFDILEKFELKEVYIGDVNADLINAYCMVRDNVEALIAMLAEMQTAFVPLSTENRKKYYLAKRERFNALKANGTTKDAVEKAALLIFLNKTCFNGLYRVNQKGLYNVPMGTYKKPLICDSENLRAVSQKLQTVQIVCGDYTNAESFIDANTFVYFDPPYRPLTHTAHFTAYTTDVFGDAKQIALARFADAMAEKGAAVLVSNSDPKNIDEDDNFFDELYAAYKIERVEATRSISCNSKARGKIKELLMSKSVGK